MTRKFTRLVWDFNGKRHEKDFDDYRKAFKEARDTASFTGKPVAMYSVTQEIGHIHTVQP